MQVILIKKNEYDEYEVPTPTEDAPDSIYFTDDRDDAVGTAHMILGDNITCIFRKGTYQ